MTIASEESEGQAPTAADAGRYDAFLSYAREDNKASTSFAVDRLRKALEERGQQVWVDVDDIPVGAQWRARVKRGIEACKAFIFVVSPASVSSEPCRQELEEALALQKLIIPVICRDVDDGAVPPAVAEAEWVYLRDEDDQPAGIARLVDALETDLEWRDRHTRLAGRAREWLDAGRDSSYLLRGSDLREAEDWLGQQEGHREAATREQAEYIARSRQATARRQRTLIGSLAAGLLVAIGLAVFALVQRQQAVTEQQSATSGELSAQALLQLSADPQLSLLLADHAARTKETSSALDALRRALPANHLIRTFAAGNSQPMTSAVWSSNGKLVLTTSQDGYARVWDASSGALVRRFPLVSDLGQGAMFDRAGREVMTWTVGSVQIWSLDSHSSPVTISDPTLAELDIAVLSPDGTLVATASNGAGGTNAIWDADTGRRVATLGYAPDAVGGDIAFSADSRLVAAGRLNGTAAVWDARTGRLEQTFRISRNSSLGIDAVAFSPDGTRVATAYGALPDNGSSPAQTQEWRLSDGRLIARMTGGDPEWSPGGAYIATTSPDGTARVWQAGNASLVSQLKSTTAISGPALFAPDSFDATTGREQITHVLTGSSSGSAAIWNAISGVQVATLAGDAGTVTAAGFSPNGTRALTYSSDGAARIWDTGVVSAIPAPTSTLVKVAADYAGSSDGQALLNDGGAVESPLIPLRAFALGSNPPSQLGQPNSMIVLNDRTGAIVTRLPAGPSYSGVAFDAAGGLMVVETYRAASGNVVALPAQLRLAQGGRLLRTLSGTGSRATAATISPDGRLVATLDGQDRIAVWDTDTGRRLTLFEGHAGRRTAFGLPLVVFKFSPDGSLILSTDDTGLTFVWRARTGRVLNRIQGAAQPPGAGYSGWGGAISPDDALFVTVADWDTTGNVYRVGQPKPLQQLQAGLFGMDDATFNHDGSLLASISTEGVSLWDVHAQSPVLTIPGDFGTAVAFTANGQSLITDGGFGAEPYDTLPCVACGGFPHLLALAHQRETTILTPAELALYTSG